MHISIIAIPDFLPDDVEYIQSLRARHDQYAGAFGAPYLTVVFPVGIAAAPPVIEHVRCVAGALAAFSFSLRCALPVYERASGRTSVYLVPERGFSAMVRVHDLLYCGPLRSALQLDVPFIPHLRVAQFDDAARAKKLADRLNDEGVSLLGTVASLQVIEVDGERFEPLARFELAAAAGVPSSRMH